MAIKFRNYVHDKRFGSDYHKVWEFLARINQNEINTPNFLWGRWTWMMSRPVDHEHLKNKIGLWEDDGIVVALATYELKFGEVFICVDKKYRFLYQEIIDYTKENLSNHDALKIIINDKDLLLQDMASKNGFHPTERKEAVSILELDTPLSYALPEGFTILSMADRWDYSQYNRVMWRGFNHEGEPDQGPEDIIWRKTMLSSPHLASEMTLAIVAPSGNYASHCGLWYHKGNSYAYVEPVATDPDYRGLGLAKAAIYESVIRAKKLGAKQAFVGSSQQFYYKIGFKPYSSETWWELNHGRSNLSSKA